MANLKLDANCGNTFNSVSQKAKRLSVDRNRIVEFDFNEIKCLVDKDTNLEWLYRDYANAWLMEWNIVGPDCLPQYEPEVAQELEKRNKLQDEKEAQRQKEQEKEDKKERSSFEEKVKGVEIELLDAAKWGNYKKINTDPYGACCVEYAEGWAKLMQVELSKGIKLIDCASSTSFELGFLGITGFMYGCAVSMLSECWKHGEELRKWHNKEYGVSEDKKGVVNPAILTFGK